MTLLEYAKSFTDDTIRSALIALFVINATIAETLPYDNVVGGGYRYDQVKTLPGVAFRGINESYTPSTGIINPQFDPLYIVGGEIDVDVALVKMYGMGRREQEINSKMKAMAYHYTSVFFKGDSTADPRVPDGLQKRIVGPQNLAAGNTSGGDALSLFTLDKFLSETVPGCNQLYMNPRMLSRLTQAARNPTLSGYITYTVDAFGRRVTNYQNIPIAEIRFDEAGNNILDFTEAGTGGGSSVCSSIYGVRMEDDGLMGIQNGPPEGLDLGQIQASPVYRTRFEWLPGISIRHPLAAGRISGIKDAAFVL